MRLLQFTSSPQSRYCHGSCFTPGEHTVTLAGANYLALSQADSSADAVADSAGRAAQMAKIIKLLRMLKLARVFKVAVSRVAPHGHLITRRK